MLKLYHFPTSVCSIKVRLGLAEIGLDYDSHVIHLPKGEQHAPAYLALNPDGVVPTLVDGEDVILESSLILEYLDCYYNDAKLMPTGRSAATTARHWLQRTLAIHAAINTLTFSTGARDVALATKTPAEIAASIAKMPDPVMGLKRADLFENGLRSVYTAQALRHLHRAFVDMDKALGSGAWLSGDTHGIVDIALLAYVDRIERLGFDGMWSDTPRIGDWLARMQGRPAYETAVSSLIDPAMAAKTRAGAEKHWPELQRIWTA